MFPTIKLNIERWKYNPTFELYVSNMGHIRNKSKADIAPKIMENGYVVVYVYGSINCYMLLHRVVMLTWKPTPEAEKLTVDHLDHNKRNNALSNLEWVTKEENERRADADYVGNIELYGNLVGCKKEEVKSIQQQKVQSIIGPNDGIQKPHKVWRKKMATAIGWKVEPFLENNLGKFSTFQIPNNKSAIDSMADKMVAYNLGGYHADKLKRKFGAILGGTTQKSVIEYCGVRFTAIFPEDIGNTPAAENVDNKGEQYVYQN
jgi:hypothetical protein